ncbi:tRNA (adenosine(37)-N6)-threonylcarbamoyltransferase complex transferase subunit TsaD [Candidatus Desulforudis audaxviator]|uniref:tRNA (adenosine(37)-N6)-threonylcarbamoyltransferase complex transferase subunit TsaD n=1 Tax=Candidatus Desulforudis audaxviator TaxID=471827 RepID=UPI001076D426|nr:tRNA (adenosine(37)-N6)-threonylcarbamoyltransferase complex transferase subunit TsaD [Candidatus Desulforudis audaxviator]AZK60572.1 putative metalloendopeptidase, glycoprotease family [Candidatus Desulforudis audaxviator]
MSVILLGVETSCDETAAAVVENGHLVRSNTIASQFDLHGKFGGVVPEVASRRHLESINPVIRQALEEADVSFRDLDGVAVTYGPGLAGSLLVGLMAAKTIAYALDIPLFGINHLEAHIYANFLVAPDLPFPLLCLIVSGGHTDLVLITRLGEYRLLGRTRDDAAGEAFDKVARVLELGYPGGPLIEKLAREGDPEAVPFPRAYLEEGTLDFSFSGLKTAVINYLDRARREGRKVAEADVAAGFQQAVVSVLVDKVLAAARVHRPGRILLAGGVAANRVLVRELERRAAAEGFGVTVPPPVFCTDNAAMVACAGYYRYLHGDSSPLTLNALAGLGLGCE